MDHELSELTGIERAVRRVRTQTILAQSISAILGTPVTQARVSAWVSMGYVPAARARAVSEATGIPVEDLLRKSKRKSRKHASQNNAANQY